MKTRAEAVALIERQLSNYQKTTPLGRPKGNKHHYGVQELRELLDFIYEAPPSDDSEKVSAQ